MDLVAPNGAEFTQCAAEAADISHEKPISVGSEAPETECAAFKPFLPDLEDVQARSSNSNPQQSLDFHVTCDLFGNNELTNALETTEAHVNSPGPETGLKEGISTLHGVSSTPEDAEFAYNSTIIVSSIPHRDCCQRYMYMAL